MRISYVLPIKWEDDNGLEELTIYLMRIAIYVELIIVDGSSSFRYNLHKRLWNNFAKHLPPDQDLNFINGKVNGVMTGLRLAQYNEVIIADDDVRYEIDQLLILENLLQNTQLVIPQNYFSPCPWHAKWDTSRTLLNRAFQHDYPGTLGIQRDFINNLGGYNGDVMFENLELIRTVQAAQGLIMHCDDVYVKRLPPTDQHFWSQRVRQAFDDHAQPLRLTFFLLLLPALILVTIWSPIITVFLMLLSIAIAEIGRRKYDGHKVFETICIFYAPCWLLERGIYTWIALYHKIKYGGIRYNNRIIKVAANPIWKIKLKNKARIYAGLAIL